MKYIIEQKKNNGIYLVEVEFSNPKEYSYTFSVGDTHYFKRYKQESRLKVLKVMYSLSRIKDIEEQIDKYSQGKLF